MEESREAQRSSSTRSVLEYSIPYIILLCQHDNSNPVCSRNLKAYLQALWDKNCKLAIHDYLEIIPIVHANIKVLENSHVNIHLSQ